MICCIDSNIFIWGIKHNCDPGQENMRERAMYFFQWVDSGNHKIMIPTVVIAEILAPEPLEKHPVYMEIISKNFIVSDFDSIAASRYAFMFMNRIEELKKTAKTSEIDAQKMKIDHLIVACALNHRADCIYSHDKGLKLFGQKYIEVKELPIPPTPSKNLFSDYLIDGKLP